MHLVFVDSVGLVIKLCIYNHVPLFVPGPGKYQMKCTVFRSSLKDYTYIYLSEDSEFDDLPIALKKVFGEPETVMSLELTPDRKLAYEDVNRVIQNLAEQGYHLPMPPQEDATGLLQLPDK